jgi:intracellular septation protein A
MKKFKFIVVFLFGRVTITFEDISFEERGEISLSIYSSDYLDAPL